MAAKKVRLKDSNQNILHPETDWSVVLNTPSVYSQAYALDKPDYLAHLAPKPAQGIVIGRMKNSVSFGLIEIDGGNRTFQSFYIVAAEETGKISQLDRKQALYYLDTDFSKTFSIWQKANINYSEDTTTYTYTSEGVTYTVYLTPLLKA